MRIKTEGSKELDSRLRGNDKLFCIENYKFSYFIKNCKIACIEFIKIKIEKTWIPAARE
jgi:hypothetical protein